MFHVIQLTTKLYHFLAIFNLLQISLADHHSYLAKNCRCAMGSSKSAGIIRFGFSWSIKSHLGHSRSATWKLVFLTMIKYIIRNRELYVTTVLFIARTFRYHDTFAYTNGIALKRSLDIRWTRRANHSGKIEFFHTFPYNWIVNILFLQRKVV